LISSTTSYTQSSLFNYVDQIEKLKYKSEVFELFPFIKDYDLVYVSPEVTNTVTLPGFTNEDRLNIAFYDTIRANYDQVSVEKYGIDNENEYCQAYVGTLSDDEASRFILLKYRHFPWMGEFLKNDRLFQVMPLNESLSVIMEIDQTSFSQKFCGVNSEAQDILEEEPTFGANMSKRSTNPCTAACSGGSKTILDVVDLDLFNMLYPQVPSGVYNGYLYMQKVYQSAAFSVSGINNTVNHGSTVYDFTNTPGGELSAMADLASLNSIFTNVPGSQADKGSLFTVHDYNFIRGIADGVPGEWAIVEVSAVSNVYAHEVGHLFGGHHENNTFSPGCNRAHIFSGNKTVMHSNSVTTSWQFSSPTIFVNGVATGTIERNNAGRIQNHFCPSPSSLQNPVSGNLTLQQTTKVLAYPDPVKYVLTIEMSGFDRFDESIVLKIRDINGQLILSQTLVDQSATVDVSELYAGIYVYELHFPFEVITKHFIKL
jgi:hypothetical protein